MATPSKNPTATMISLGRCKDQGDTLNTYKLTIRLNEVPFIGHVSTDKGLRVDTSNVQSMSEIPTLADKEGVQRLLALAQYLKQFLAHQSDIT